jgi:heme exporter protein C
MAQGERIERLGLVAGWLAIPALAIGLYLGLIWAPTDVMMGDVQRVMYVHFPSWIAVAIAYTTGFVCSIAYLVRRRPTMDYLAHAGVEVGVLFNITGLMTGSIWGRPTWGVWWTWDARLTTTALMLAIFLGYLAVRSFLEDPESRARIAALVATIGFLNLPIVYFSVRWFRTIHQIQSSPETVDPEMVLTLRVMFVAFALLTAYLISRRYAVARLEGERERVELQPEAQGG